MKTESKEIVEKKEKKKPIGISSRKAKGRNLQNKIRDTLFEAYQPLVEQDDIKCAIMGENGCDIHLSPQARKVIAPLAVEAKCVEKLNIWSALEQCEKNTKKDEIPVLFFKRNRSKTYCVLELDNFMKFLKAYSELNKK